MSRREVSWDGMTEDEALDLVLGPERRTDDRTADLVTAYYLTEKRERAVKIILHALHKELGSWKKVAKAVGRPQTTVWSWAHPRREV